MSKQTRIKLKLGATKQTSDPTGWNNGSVKLNDIGFRVILIPFFGIIIPLITKLVNHESFTLWQIKLSYLYTIGIAFVVWHGNRFLLFTLRSYFDWFNKPIRKICALLIAVHFYTIPISVLMLVGWYALFKKGNTDWNQVWTTTLIIMIAVLFIVHVYETVFLVKEAESEKVLRARTEKAKAEAELAALKTQIDPHFIFNSLNTLSHLIEDDPAKARKFNDHLADVYRYILHNKTRDLVLVSEEIGFLRDYFSLLQIRFENAVHLSLLVPESEMDQFLIPPISLQILAENAIKHNDFNEKQPLHLEVRLENNELIVNNNMSKKLLRKTSSRIGLQNLDERYKLTTSKSITVLEAERNFTVNLPILKIA
ncbi:sensor histidine kinase [Pollutibacter soli]|uniref:sensor histidine kinase n=1 Tax=Pollutibacter soli TaxID=3034157 RepID=UPI0030132621